MDTNSQTGDYETPKDAGPGPEGIVKRWTVELELSEKVEKDWRQSAQDALSRYRGESKTKEQGNFVGLESDGPKFNILFSNVQTICPAIYNSAPKPDVRRRFRGENAVARQAADVLEKALSYTMDASDLDACLQAVVQDMQIVGRGVLRLRYNPTFQSVSGLDLEGQPIEGEELVYEEVMPEVVQWEDFRHGPGRRWEEVPWVAFQHLLTREELEAQFGKVGDDVAFDYSPKNFEDNRADQSDIEGIFKRAKVWEIWHKDRRQVLWIAPSYKNSPLRIDEDPLGLEGFFPMPAPLDAITTSGTLVPIEPFRFYKGQADELDEMTRRIAAVIDACRVRAVYDSRLGTDIGNLLSVSETAMVPTSQDFDVVLQGGGSLEKALYFWPIDKIANVLGYLYNQREAVKQVIYEITGIADIMRGSTKASETLGAQRIKAQFGTMRLDDTRRRVNRFARDTVRLMAEIIAERFEPQTLMLMTGEALTPEVVQLLRSDGMRGFRIDVETENTVAADLAQEQKNMTDLLTGITSYVSAVGPAVQAGYIPLDGAKALLMSAVRRFRLGREVEDTLDQMGGPQQGQPQTPDQAQTPQQPQVDPRAEAEAAKMQSEIAITQRKAEADIEIAQKKAEAEIALKREEMLMTMEREKSYPKRYQTYPNSD